jgi:hypothetical protein
LNEKDTRFTIPGFLLTINTNRSNICNLKKESVMTFILNRDENERQIKDIWYYLTGVLQSPLPQMHGHSGSEEESRTITHLSSKTCLMSGL